MSQELKTLYNTIVCCGGINAPRSLWAAVEKLQALGYVKMEPENGSDWRRVVVECVDRDWETIVL